MFGGENSEKCINCLSELTDEDCRLNDHFDFDKGTFTRRSGAPKKKKGRRARHDATTPVVEVDAFQALNMIFQIGNPDRGHSGVSEAVNIPSADEGLCVACTEILGQLFRFYIQFVSTTRLSSYIHAALEKIESLQRNLGGYLQARHNRSLLDDTCTLFNSSTVPRSMAGSSARYKSTDAPDRLGEISSDVGDTEQQALENEATFERRQDEFDLPNSMKPNFVLERLKVEVKVEPLDPDPDIETENCGFTMDHENVDHVSSTPSELDIQPKRSYRKRLRARDPLRKSDREYKTFKPSSDKTSQIIHTSSLKRHSPCKKCCEVFNYKSHLELHMNTHTDVSKEECSICVCAFKARYQLRAHMSKEHPEAPVPWLTNSNTTFSDFICSFCKIILLSEGALKRHFVVKHMHCPVCKTDHPTKEVARAHMESQHGPHWVNPLVVCEFCGYAAKGARAVRRHKIHAHNEVSSKSCEVCGKNFDSTDGLKKHLRVHTGERPFKCDRCPMTFKYASNLVDHKAIHDGVKLICDHCGHASSTPANLRLHIRAVHFGIQPKTRKRPPDAVVKKRVRARDLVNSSSILQNQDSPLTADQGQNPEELPAPESRVPVPETSNTTFNLELRPQDQRQDNADTNANFIILIP